MTAARFWKHPLLPIGIVLLVVGIGNWWISRAKLVEYTQRLQVSAPVTSGDLSDYRELDSRTNATLLRRLHRAPAMRGMAAAKRDFYALVNNGGRLIALLGLALATAGLIRFADDRGTEPSHRRVS